MKRTPALMKTLARVDATLALSKAVDAAMGDPVALKRVQARMDAALGSASRTGVRMECPECGHAGPHDGNGDVLDPQALCAGCGSVFNV